MSKQAATKISKLKAELRREKKQRTKREQALRKRNN